jgi:hypothetical protein
MAEQEGYRPTHQPTGLGFGAFSPWHLRTAGKSYKTFSSL